MHGLPCERARPGGSCRCESRATAGCSDDADLVGGHIMSRSDLSGTSIVIEQADIEPFDRALA